MAIEGVYDAMGPGYLHGKTTNLYRGAQRYFIQYFFAKARGDDDTRWYSGMEYLIVGPGPAGNVEEWVNQATLSGYYLDAVDPRHITYLDNSPVVLRLCEAYVRREVSRLVGKPGHGQFVLGSGEELKQNFNPETFDVVLGALCDHLDPVKFFAESYRVLKPGGVLITSFPAEGINRVVREEIYGIPSDHTRFVIDGESCLVPSRLMTPESLRQLYGEQGFCAVETIGVSAGNLSVSETLERAAGLVGSDPQVVPLVVVGFGRKSGREIGRA